MLIDTHCHLYTFEEEVSEVLTRANEANVNRTICIGAGHGLESADLAIRLADNYQQVFATVGIHPHDAKEGISISALENHLFNEKVIAVGETGLDFFRDWSPKNEQERVFRETISVAKKIKKPLIIHCRDAFDDTLRILKEENASDVGGVFHCFAGDYAFAKKIFDLNFIVSFPGNVTFKKATNIQETAKAMPLDKFMLETDAPYMAPEPYRGGKSEPMHVKTVAEFIAKLKNIDFMCQSNPIT